MTSPASRLTGFVQLVTGKTRATTRLLAELPGVLMQVDKRLTRYDAEDAASKTAAIVHERGNTNGDPWAFVGLALKIARRDVISTGRKQRTVEKYYDWHIAMLEASTAVWMNPEVRMEIEAACRVVDVTVAKMPKRQRQVWCTWDGETSYETIAAVLGMRVENVWKHMCLARARVKAALEAAGFNIGGHK